MYTEKPGGDNPEPKRTEQKFALRHYVIGLTIHVLALILLQVFGLHGIIPHIIAAGVCQWVELMRQRNG